MSLMDNLAGLIGTVTAHARAIRELQLSVAEAHAQIRRGAWMADNTVIHGKVTDVDPEKHLYRQEIGEDEEGNPVKSPWLPYSQIAGTRKHHSAPSVGQQMTLLAPAGNIERAVSLPLTWWNDNPSPSTKGDEDVDLRGRTRHTQKDADYKTEIDGVTRHYTKQSQSLTIHKDPENEEEGQGEEVSDKKPWKGNRAKTKHKRVVSKDGGYVLTINDGDSEKEHKIVVKPTDEAVEISTHTGKHKIVIKKEKIEAAFDNGKHKTTIDDTGIKHSVDNGAHEVQINSSSGGLGSMAGGALPGALGASNMGALTNQLRSLLGSGGLAAILGGGGGGLGGLLGGQLAGLLGPTLLAQLQSDLSSALGGGTLGGMLQPGIVHKSSSTVQIESPQIEHMGNLKVSGSLKATQVIQSAIGLKGPLVNGFPGDPGEASDW